jgi:DNA-binding IscR family transcriptional regulator
LSQEFFIKTSYPTIEAVKYIHEELAKMARELNSSELFFTLKELAERLDRYASKEVGGEKGIGGCLNVLDKNEVLKRIYTFDRVARIKLGNLPERALPRGRQTLVLELLQTLLRGKEHEEVSIKPDDLCKALEIDRTQLITSLQGLKEKGFLAVYEPPGRSGGVMLLKPGTRLNLGKAAEDEIDNRRNVELEKLQQMVGYTDAECRRRYLIDYFGQAAPFRRCGTCDVCQRTRQASVKTQSGLP